MSKHLPTATASFSHSSTSCTTAPPPLIQTSTYHATVATETTHSDVHKTGQNEVQTTPENLITSPTAELSTTINYAPSQTVKPISGTSMSEMQHSTMGTEDSPGEHSIKHHSFAIEDSSEPSTLETIEETSKEGVGTTTEGAHITTEGADTTAEGVDTTVEGADTTVEGADITVEGVDTTMEGVDTAVEGVDTTVEGVDTTAEGVDTTVEGVDTANTSAINMLESEG